MKGFPYLRIANLIFNQPQMVTPAMLDMASHWANRALNLNIVNLSVSAGGAEPQAFDDGDDYALRAARASEQRMAAARATGVQVIPIHGLLVPRETHLDPCSTSTSYEDLRSQFAAAVMDPQIEHIVMDVDSPGGSVAGCFELAREIHDWAQAKPITSVINFGGYSAAYQLSAAANKIIVSPSSGVGSIGVIARHMDVSRQNEANGVVVTTIYAGDHKNDLSPHEPLSDQAAESLRQIVQDAYGTFVGSVAEFRGLTPDAVRATQAQVYYGQRALDIGLADAVETPQAAVNRIAGEVAAARSSRARPPGSRASVAARAGAMNARTQA